MDTLHTIYAWVLANKWLLASLLGIATNVANGLSTHPKAQNVLNWLIEMVSLVAKKDAPTQSLKMPFTTSAGAPKWKNAYVDPVSFVPLLPYFMIAHVFFLSSCSAQFVQKHPLVVNEFKCVESELPAALLTLVIDALVPATGPDWSLIGQTEAKYGVDLVKCAVDVLSTPDAVAGALPDMAPHTPEVAAARSLAKNELYFERNAGVYLGQR